MLNNSSDDSKNLILALVLTMAILFGYNHFFGQKPVETLERTSGLDVPADTVSRDHLVDKPSKVQSTLSKEDYRKQNSKSISVETPTLKGTISLKGAALNDLILKQYKQTTQKNSADVDLLYPLDTATPYFVNAGWLSEALDVDVPNRETMWHAQQDKLTPDTPIILSYTNKQGVVFERTLSVDDKYMFTVVDRVTNKSGKVLNLYPYAFVTQGGSRLKGSDYMAYFVGALGVLNDTLKEVSFDEMAKAKIQESSKGGWVGFTDKYWLTALIPDQDSVFSYEFREVKEGSLNDRKLYQTAAKGGRVSIEDGATHTSTLHFYTGAKDINLLDSYEQTINVPKFDRAIDFGWYYIITKPLLYTLNFLHGYIANMGICILLLTVFVKILFFPLANKSYRAMARMKTLQPKIKELQERFGDDKMKLNQEMMELYKREKVNPVSGCMPMLVQIPVFFGLYKVLFISLEMRQAPFFGWVHDLSVPDPTNLFTLFGLIPWTTPDFMHLGVWPLLLGVSMLVQQKMSPQPGDPTQAKVMMVLPLVFTFMFASFPVGLVVYWAWNNILSMGQQWVISKQAERESEQEEKVRLEAKSSQPTKKRKKSHK